MKTTIRDEFKQWQQLPVVGPEPSEPPQGLGVRWVRGEGTHRFGLDARSVSESGVSPVPRQPCEIEHGDLTGKSRAFISQGQPPHSKTLARADERPSNDSMFR